MKLNFAKAVLTTVVASTLYLGNYSVDESSYINEDNDYTLSEIVKKLGNFGVNSASANVEVIVVTGERIPAPKFVPRIRSFAAGGVSFGENDESTAREEEAQREVACQRFEENNQPVGCFRAPNPLDLLPNGCSAPRAEDLTGVARALFEQIEPVVDFTNDFFESQCNDHDRCYTSLGASKIDCDVGFRVNLNRRCVGAAQAGISRTACEGAAGLYVGAVIALGGEAFTTAQANSACSAYIIERNKRRC
ncbi:hypothetical protein EYS14_13420 [Alteromonadaceae bacterium M269]|nr:hypothetical protein EYS14_13420 [Alteromonadaceae bacterium M269]